MKRFLSICLILLFSFISHLLHAQDLIYNKSVTGVCYAGTKTSRIFIPPPEKFLRNKGNKGGGTITVYYYGFNTETRTAFDYAISILETMLPADTKTTVLAYWQDIQTTGVLGNSTVTAIAGGWAIDAFKPFAFYPVALAEKIAGKSLNSDQQGDIIMTLDSKKDWYLGTDGKVPVNSRKYDLVTVILHEMCHGLGFFDSMDTDDNTGFYGFSSVPVIYDTFIENLIGEQLTDTLKFRNNTMALRQQMTGENLYFKGPVFKALTGENRTKVFAPSTWDDGSSISHLDETVTLVPNNLMTPYIDMEEVIHDPGIFTTAILGDLGWINTRIIHEPKGDTEEHLSQVEISVEIKSDTTFNRDKVALVYSFDGFESSDTSFMTSFSSDNKFTANLPLSSYNKELQYYFFTEDVFKRIFHLPSLYQMFRFKSYIGTDTIIPVIIHSPSKYYFDTEDTIRFSAEVSDNIGIDTVYMEYRINDESSSFIGLMADSADIFTALLTSDILNWAGGDSLKYRIFAKDSSGIPNIAVTPVSGFYSIGIEAIGSVIDGYSTDFSNAESDFFLSGFEIKRPVGFLKYGLHTRHPYESPEVDDESLDFIAMLRNPVKLDKSGILIEYSDIALVEPGETGALFGSQEFYDYVVLEGSKNFGKTWHNLFTGYDASFNSNWLKSYNSSIVDQNSTTVGTESMFIKHNNLFTSSNVFNTDDTLLIRFRLFSDPYANGWGWAIQDLKINPLIDGIEKPVVEKVRLYPNPGNGFVRIVDEGGLLTGGEIVKFEVFNSSGIPVLKGNTSGGPETSIDLSGLPSGLYIIILYHGDGIRAFKYSLIK
ncbi:MAG TPA: T9SS type A sorting domain-containing protein [Bacteroidales bacterium]|nr:T9SS type A sorting domain-containing protein [Bacteroidales bacterium]